MYCLHKRDDRDNIGPNEVPVRKPSIGMIGGRHGSLVVANGIYAGGTLNGTGKFHDNSAFVSDNNDCAAGGGVPNAALTIVKEMPALHLEHCKLWYISILLCVCNQHRFTKDSNHICTMCVNTNISNKTINNQKKPKCISHLIYTIKHLIMPLLVWIVCSKKFHKYQGKKQ